jgi:hypothetical protein
MEVNYKKLYEQKCQELEIEIDKNNYNSIIIDIIQNNKNIGEKDELLLILKLHNLNHFKNYKELADIFGEEANEGITIINMDTKEKLNIFNLTKAKSCFKSDVTIKMNKTNNLYNCSIKSKKGANPTILNHTPRNAKVFAKEGILGNQLGFLDQIINEYIDKRNKKIIGEDIHLIELESIKNIEIEDAFIEVLGYFMFEGSGKGDSREKANSILCIEENNQINFIKCITKEQKKEYIKNTLEKYIVSLRDKGMPKNIDDIVNPWIYKDIKENGNIKLKGSLHIRSE